MARQMADRSRELFQTTLTPPLAAIYLATNMVVTRDHNN